MFLAAGMHFGQRVIEIRLREIDVGLYEWVDEFLAEETLGGGIGKRSLAARE